MVGERSDETLLQEAAEIAPRTRRALDWERELAWMALSDRGNMWGDPYMSKDRAVDTIFGSSTSPDESDDKGETK